MARETFPPVPTGRKRTGPGILPGPLVPFCFGMLLICLQFSENYKMAKLKATGQRTLGRLEMVKHTIHFPLFFWPDYSFDVSYTDGTGARHHSWLKATAGLHEQHTRDGMFTRHLIEVVFLQDKPGVAGLPGALGPSVAGFVIGPPFILLGWAWRRNSRGSSWERPPGANDWRGAQSNLLVSAGTPTQTRTERI